MKLQCENQLKTDMKGFAGKKGFGLFASVGVAQQGGLEAVQAGEVEHVA